MHIARNDIDSRIMGDTVADIVDFSADENFEAFEKRYLSELDPRYVVCKIPLENLKAVHQLEAAGFRFLEFQIRSTLRLPKQKKYNTKGFPYAYEPVETQSELGEVVEIAGTTFTEARYRLDPDLASEKGGDYYRFYTRRSFEQEDELIHKLYNVESKEIVGFNTCKIIGEKDVQLFLAGVKAEYKNAGLGTILNYYVFNDFIDRGIRNIVTHQSGINYPILNVELGHFNFRVVQGFAVLRKLYQ